MADNHCGHFTCKWYDRKAEERCGAPSPEAVAAAGCPELSEEERRSTPPVADEVVKPSEGPYRPVVEDGQWLVIDTSRKIGPHGAALPVVMTAHCRADAEVEAHALNSVYERGKAAGVRDEREACAVVVDALATKLATTVHECAHELGLACAVCDASREAHATVSTLRGRGGDGKGGA